MSPYLRRLGRWAVNGIVLALAARWLLIRLRRVLLLPTGEYTPSIRAAEISTMRRIIVSDIHLGAADRLDDFDADQQFVAFVQHYVARDEPVELILAGDTFEFLQVRLPGLGDYEWSGAAAERRLQAICAGHPEVIGSLRTFVGRPGNQLTVLIGNHDFELHYGAAKRLLRRSLGLEEHDPRLRFGTRYEGGGIYLEHGNQFDEWNSFVYFEGISEPFEVVRGTRVVKDVINPLEDDPLEVAPLIDNVKPTSAFLWYMLSLPRLQQPEARRYVVRGLLRLFRTVALPRVYQARPVLEVREELLGAPGATLDREVALQAVYALEPTLREAAAARHGGVEPEVRLRRRGAIWSSGLVQGVARRLAGSADASDAALEEIEAEAGRQLRQEISTFKGATLNAMARIAASPVHQQHRLFVCGHTHLAEVVTLNDRQTYVNTGTWTEVVRNIATYDRGARRFPFLEVVYPNGADAPEGRLLVWDGPDAPPQPWSRIGEV